MLFIFLQLAHVRLLIKLDIFPGNNLKILTKQQISHRKGRIRNCPPHPPQVHFLRIVRHESHPPFAKFHFTRGHRRNPAPPKPPTSEHYPPVRIPDYREQSPFIYGVRFQRRFVQIPEKGRTKNIDGERQTPNFL